MPTLDQNPFAALTLIAAPAVLTNACSVLALGTSNRFARAVDRQRQLSALLETAGGGLPEERDMAAMWLKQLHISEQRGRLLLRALTSFYLALGSFAAASLVSLLGSFVHDDMFILVWIVRWVALIVGGIGVGGLVIGCSLLVRETRITLHALRDEAAFTSRRFALKHGPRKVVASDEQSQPTPPLDDERA